MTDLRTTDESAGGLVVATRVPIPERSSLPALAYVSDTPVESSYHGSALIYRLLQNYPADRLRVVEAGISESLPERRLAGVRYEKLYVGHERLLRTRFHRWVGSYYTWSAPRRARKVSQLLANARVDAVLTIAHGYSWLAAARYARSQRKPLHLIIHDDWPRMAPLVGSMPAWLDTQFGIVYRQAASRLCVSPYMAEEYGERYGIGATVLYPSRAADVQVFRAPPERMAAGGGGLVFGFGGSINTVGQRQALQRLAVAIEPWGGRLNIYGPISQDSAEKAGLTLPNVRICGLVKAEEFVTRIRADLDVLFLPMSFDAEDRPNMRLCFPSKLTEYSATGLPILIYGPSDSSAVRWARENRGAAEVVEEEEGEDLANAVRRLQRADYRQELGYAALRAGETSFSHAHAQAIFFGALA